MKISDLPPSQLKTRLNREGICLKTGPFVICVQSGIPFVYEAVRDLYTDFHIAEPGDFVDFHARVSAPRGLRHYVRPQALFETDGETPFHPMPLRLAVPLLEWGLNWCIAARAHQYLMIHAAVLERGGKALLIPAPSGTGKSTLCAALCWSGWRLLTDELCLVRRDDLRIVPLPRPVGLKDASIDVIRSFAARAWISRGWPDTSKGTLAHMRPPADAVARAHEPAAPAWVIFVKYLAGSPARLEPVARSRSFLRFADNAVNYSLLGSDGFETVGGVIDATTSHDLTYGDLREAIDALDRLCRQNECAGA